MQRPHLFRASINEAKRRLKTTKDRAHDILHAKRVVKNTELICGLVAYKNGELLEVAAWWHDVGRIYNSDHEKLSAELALKDLKERGLNADSYHKVYEIIRFHKWNMKPKILEGHILRDADKLDFISIARWEACLEVNQLEHIKEIKVLLPRLNDLLKLSESKQVYAKRIDKFNQFYQNIDLL